ncbi:single-stranded DNA-binding protein [Pasteurella testudinis]|uniref:single-stranded DNA-binding protein n=1 Tax=Pasteurella testudinis TaxID=761 RepID=UPI00405A3AEB
MAGVNRVTILGNLGADPEIRVMPNGDLVATLSVATSRTWKDKASGESKELTEWHRIVLYRRVAEIARDYLHKGSKAYFEGYLRTQKWTDNNGVERWTTQIIAETLQLLDPKPASSEIKAAPVQNSAVKAQEPPLDFDDGIPF